MERVGTHKYLYVLAHKRDHRIGIQQVDINSSPLFFSDISQDCLSSNLSGRLFHSPYISSSSEPSAPGEDGQRLRYSKPEPSLKTDSQHCVHAPAINSAVKEAEGLLDPFLLFPPLRYYMLCALTHPLPQEVGYLEENRTEVLERQKKREH